MPSPGPSTRAGIFKKLKPDPSRRQILFLKGQKDHLLVGALTPECRSALVAFLDKCWNDFETAYRASSRNTAYAGLVTSLTFPYNQEWYPHWIVHWQIVSRQDADPPFDFEDYILAVEKLEHRDI